MEVICQMNQLLDVLEARPMRRDGSRREHPVLYEGTPEWFICGLSLVAAAPAGSTYWATVMA